MRKSFILFIIIFEILSLNSFGQKDKIRNIFPIWTFHQDSINIHGFSLGLWSFNDEPRITKTNGIRAELIGAGILIPLIPESPIAKSDSAFERIKQIPISEKINGINISGTGSVCHCKINGITIGPIGQKKFQVNGISFSLLMNFSQSLNGIMFSFYNETYHLKGLQIGLINKSKNLHGIQIGLWNVNQKRKLPFINWNFK